MRMMARAIANRLLHEPTVRLKRTTDDDAAYPYVHALRELFGLDPASAPVESEDAAVTELRPRRNGESN
jgi:hypothetical protein